MTGCFTPIGKRLRFTFLNHSSIVGINSDTLKGLSHVTQRVLLKSSCGSSPGLYLSDYFKSKSNVKKSYDTSFKGSKLAKSCVLTYVFLNILL
jgi:hypothetical protein